MGKYTVKNGKLAGETTNLLGQSVEFDKDGFGTIECSEEDYLNMVNNTQNFEAANADDVAKAKEKAEAEAEAQAEAEAEVEAEAEKSDEPEVVDDSEAGEGEAEAEVVADPTTIDGFKEVLDNWEVKYDKKAKFAELKKLYDAEKAKREEEKKGE